MNYKIVNGAISFGADTILEEINFEIKDKDKIDMQKIPAKIRYLRFAGRILSGGISSGNSTYTSADKEFLYTLNGADFRGYEHLR